MEVCRMKRIYVMLLGLLLLCSCADGSTGGVMPDNGETAAYEEEGEEEPEAMEDLMKISTWVLDPELEGKGYWMYSDDMKNHRYQGYWVPNEGEPAVADEDVFALERLEVGVPRTAIMNYGTQGVDIQVDFEGIVEVTKKEPSDNSILIDFYEDDYWDQWNGLTSIRRNGPVGVSVLPVGKLLSYEGVGGPLGIHSTLTGKEYTIVIKGYELDGKLMVTAELKLTTIPDEGFPYEEVMDNSVFGYGEIYQYGEDRTRFCSIELVSYEYSDQYKMMQME